MLSKTSGFDLLMDIKSQIPDSRILVLSQQFDDKFAIKVLRAGASGFLTRRNISRSFVQALRKIYEGHKYISSRLANQLAAEIGLSYEKPLHETLTNREFEVMKLIAKRKSVAKIAEALCVSYSIVRADRSRILEKMKFAKDAEIIKYALEQKLIQ
jgi:DNA-binding NarL/FixJ family response regulator